MPEDLAGKVGQYTGLRNNVSTLPKLIKAILLIFAVLLD